MKKILFALLLVVCISCSKDKETVEIEKIVEVDTNPFVILANIQVEDELMQEANPEPVIANFKSFAKGEGKDFYGFYLYYGGNEFSNLNSFVTDGKALFVLCVDNFQITRVYGFGLSGMQGPNSYHRIDIEGGQSHLQPNQTFYNNTFLGFITKDEVLKL